MWIVKEQDIYLWEWELRILHLQWQKQKQTLLHLKTHAFQIPHNTFFSGVYIYLFYQPLDGFQKKIAFGFFW
jgi:hypothetical protein